MDSLLNKLSKFFPAFIRLLGILAVTGFCALVIILNFQLKNVDHKEATSNLYYQILFIFESWEESFSDLRVASYVDRENLTPIDGPILLEVDDNSLSEIGTFPIPRNYWAQALDKLNTLGAKVVAFDVLFPEKSLSCGTEETDYDQLLIDAINRFQSVNGNQVVLAFTNTTDPSLALEPPFSLVDTMITVSRFHEKYDVENQKLDHNYSGKTKFPINYLDKSNFVHESFLETQTQLGYINNSEDYDGVYRHYTLFSRSISNDLEGSLFLPSLGLAAYRASVKSNKLSFEFDPNLEGNSYLKENSSDADRRVFVNGQGKIKIKWKGEKNYFPSVSLWTLLNHKEEDGPIKDMHNFATIEFIQSSIAKIKKSENPDQEELEKLEKRLKQLEPYKYIDFENKIVFVGSSAAGWHDLRNTPISPILPGVYAHMTLAHMLQEHDYYKGPDETMKNTLSILIGSVVLLCLIMLFNNAILDITSLIVIILGILLLDKYYFFPQNYDLKLLFVIIANVSCYSFITILNFSKASAEKKQIKGAFSRYVAPAIVNDMLENPDKLKVGGDRKDITCLFSDVRDFTSISEKLTPTELASALNRYMGEMTDIVFETNGTLDKYIGDAIVAFWGAPLDIGDHVNQAMEGAVRMLEALPAINAEFAEKNLPEFKIGLGLNSGECSVGNMGSDAIFAYTALGDNMNLGARLESLCKYYGAQILISEFTYERMNREKYISRCIDKVRVKGKTEPVGVYEVLYSYHPLMLHQNALRDFKNAYDLYIQGKFAKARELFEAVLSVVPEDKASIRMIENCQYWMDNPPGVDDDWTITTMTTK